MTVEDVFDSAIEDSITLRRAASTLSPLVAAAVRKIVESYQANGKVLAFGNGGAAADAQHIVGELVGRFRFERPALPAIALGSDASVSTAIGNDYGYSQLFSRQGEAHGKLGDVAIGISTSGHSPNVIEGLAKARQCGLVTIGMCGADDSDMLAVSDICISVQSSDTARIQELTMMIGHVICECVESEIFSK